MTHAQFFFYKGYLHEFSRKKLIYAKTMPKLGHLTIRTFGMKNRLVMFINLGVGRGMYSTYFEKEGTGTGNFEQNIHHS
jgi:hypothetical protein